MAKFKVKNELPGHARYMYIYIYTICMYIDVHIAQVFGPLAPPKRFMYTLRLLPFCHPFFPFCASVRVYFITYGHARCAQDSDSLALSFYAPFAHAPALRSCFCSGSA